MDPEFAHAIVYDRRVQGGVWRGLILYDLQRADTRSLNPASANEQAAIPRWPEQEGAGSREIGMRIKITGDANSMPQDGGFHIVACVHVDPPHELDEFAGFSAIVTAVFVNCLAYKVKAHVRLSRI